MSLNSIRVHRDDLVEGVEGDIADIVVPVREELAQNVDGHHAKSTVRLDLQNSKDCLVQDGIPNVFGRVSVGCDLPLA